MADGIFDMYERWGTMPDHEWEALWTRNYDTVSLGPDFPTFPASEVQIQFVGSSYSRAMSEAFSFYHHVKRIASDVGRPLRPDMNFLDFGCGWGRFLRIFCKDFRAENIFGVDIDSDILSSCRLHRVPGHLSLISPLGSIVGISKSVDLVLAYSVFTHLPESVHLHWMEEIASRMSSGGLFCLTLESRRFFNYVTEASSTSPSEWQRGMARFASDASRQAAEFDKGQFVYFPTGGGDHRPSETYGDAVVPMDYIEAYWTKHFRVVSYTDDPAKFWQAVLVVQKR